MLCGDIKRRVGSHEKVAFLELLLLTLRKALYPLFFESIGNLCLQRKDIVLCAKPYASTPSLTYKIGKVRYDEYHFIACIPPFVPKVLPFLFQYNSQNCLDSEFLDFKNQM
jgi:hypothetical protein